MSLALLLGIMPAMGDVAKAEIGTEKIQSGVSTITKSVTVIGLNGYEWYAIGYNGEGVYSTAGDKTVTLLLKTGQTGDRPYADTTFNTNDNTNKYGGSNLQTSMQGVYDSFNNEKEQGLIKERDLTDVGDGAGNTTTVESQKVWPLSTDEFDTIGDAGVRVYSNFWWLRSPDPFNYNIAFMGHNFGFNYFPNLVFNNLGVRPALNLNLESILFTSAANSRKVSGDGQEMLAAEPPTEGAIKFTCQSDELSLTSVTTKKRVGNDITFKYKGATTGKALSAIVKGQDGTIKYYGKLINSTSAADGEATLTIPDDLAATDKISIFTEELNGDNYTDFASKPVEISMQPQQYTITATSGANGKISPSGSVKAYTDTSKTFTVTPNKGYKLSKVTLDGKTIKLTNGKYTLANINENHSLKATFVANKYTIKFSGNGNGKAYKSKSVSYNSKLGTLVKPTRKGYNFNGWYTKKTGGSKVTSATTMKSTATTTLYAHWEKNAKITNCYVVEMHKSPATNATVNAYIKTRTPVSVIGKVKTANTVRSTWYKVSYNGKTGYVYYKFVKMI